MLNDAYSRDYGTRRRDQTDTWCVNGRTLNVDQFGNFIAGFGAQAYDQTYPMSPIMTNPLLPYGGALTVTIDFGVFYHLIGATKAVNDPLDLTGIPDILDGADYAKNFSRSSPSSCGCN